MKALTLILSLFLVTSCLKKKEEETSDSVGSDKKKKEKTKDNDDDDVAQADPPLNGKWRFTPGEAGYRILDYTFTKVASMDIGDVDCGAPPAPNPNVIYWNFTDEDSMTSIYVYDECKISVAGLDFDWNENNGNFTLDFQPMKLTKNSNTLTVKMHPIHTKWFLDLYATDDDLIVNGETYYYKFSKVTPSNLPPEMITSCDDPEFQWVSTEINYIYSYYADESYEFKMFYKDLENGLFCEAASDISGYTTVETTTLTFLNGVGGPVNVSYIMLFTNNFSNFYLR